MTEKPLPNERLLSRLRQAFHNYGYEQPSVVDLARACEVTRRTLYNYFRDKEDAFRVVLRWEQRGAIDAGLDAGTRVLAEGGSALDTIVAIIDTRYGETWRAGSQSPHVAEINHAVFRHCRDLTIAFAAEFQDRLTAFLTELSARGRLHLRPDTTPAELAQWLTDAARGINQTYSSKPETPLAERYRRMFAVILAGCTDG